MNFVGINKKLQPLFDTTDIGLALIDTDFRVVLHNTALTRFFGKPASDCVGYPCYELFRDRHGICPGCPGKLAMESCEPVIQPPANRIANGEQIHAFPWREKSGPVSGFLLIVQRHPGAKKESLTERERQFRLMVDALPAMVWLSSSEDNCTYFNKSWLEFTGWTLEEELAKGWADKIHPGDFLTRATKVSQAIMKGQKFKTHFRLCRSDGNYWRILETAAPRFSPEGNFLGYVGFCVDFGDCNDVDNQPVHFSKGVAGDISGGRASLNEIDFDLKNEISERIRIEDKLYNRPDKLNKKQQDLNQLFHLVHCAKLEWESTMDCVKEVVVLVDSHGRIRRCNMALAKMTGRGYSDLIGMHIQEAFNQEEFPIDSLLGQQTEVCYELDGKWFLLNSYPLDHYQGAGGAVVTLYDYTSLKQLTCSLEESNRRLEIKTRQLEQANAEIRKTHAKVINQEKMATIGQLSAGVAHEINNPIGFISSNLRTLQKYLTRLTQFIHVQEAVIQADGSSESLRSVNRSRKELKPDFIIEDVNDLIEESLDGADRVRKIVQDLKTFSRVDESEWKFVDLVECFERTINIVWNEIKYKATLIRDFCELPPVRCYPHQLNQVFMNLLVNAAQAIDKEGRIIVKAWQEEQSVLFSVADDGCGIPAENVSKIFEPFFTTKEIGKGTGLGLSLSYEIVKKHRGEISVASEPGKGTVFTVSLPIDVRKMPGK